MASPTVPLPPAIRRLVAVGLALLAASSFAAEPVPRDWSAPGPFAVTNLVETWTDPARGGRAVPVKAWMPVNTRGPCPVVLFSHGLGGSREGYEYFARHLASHGYLSLHVQHAGSDRELLAGALREQRSPMAAMQRAALDPANAIHRPKDLSFALDRAIAASKADGPWKGRVDATRVGVAGHSFGAYTALAVAGQAFAGTPRFRDPRVRAAVVMSPPANAPSERQFEAITIPVLLMTGTLDESPIGNSTARNRRKVFSMLTGAEAYLLDLDGGDHMVFSGRGRMGQGGVLPGMKGDGSRDPAFQACIKATSLAFFDAWLRDDADARQWLVAEDGALGFVALDAAWDHHSPATER